MFGAKIGRKVRINPSARVFLPWNLTIWDYATIGSGANLYSVGPIRIGARATVSQYTHICAGGHDPSSTTLDLTRPPISIGEDAWVAADAFVGPGVTIGRGAIVSARAAVFANVDDMVIVSGNPARPQGFRDIQD
ncbi:acetyltransferase [Mameliella sp. CS4]|uniref:acetyltransferase n=1 Tax=Mameliella sp. CS4 TaxID=2862329 RepID=UPI001C5E759B|nr:acetyltransferase [Mameliella sp. CS4]MBW4985686.1 acetyltransferase [Mameliella sp. CS4]